MTTMNRDILEALTGIGLDDNAALIYLAALELGPSTVWEIAKKSGVKRPTCYVLLDNLVFRALASKTSSGKAALYSVISPKQLLARVRVREERLEKHLYELEGLASQSKVKPGIRFYEGLEGLKEAFNLEFDQPRRSTILVYATSTIEGVLPDWVEWYYAQKKKHDIFTNVLFADTPENHAIAARDKDENRISRFLSPRIFNPAVEMDIFGDTLLYAVHSDRDPFATVIENPSIANMQRETFKILWEIAKPLKPASIRSTHATKPPQQKTN